MDKKTAWIIFGIIAAAFGYVMDANKDDHDRMFDLIVAQYSKNLTQSEDIARLEVQVKYYVDKDKP